jgi:hypothetical protein
MAATHPLTGALLAVLRVFGTSITDKRVLAESAPA